MEMLTGRATSDFAGKEIGKGWEVYCTTLASSMFCDLSFHIVRVIAPYYAISEPLFDIPDCCYAENLIVRVVAQYNAIG